LFVAHARCLHALSPTGSHVATSPDNIEHNRADTARTPSPATRTAQREPQQASAALRQSGHPLPRGDPGRQGAHRQARASLSRQGARDPVQDCDPFGIAEPRQARASLSRQGARDPVQDCDPFGIAEPRQARASLSRQGARDPVQDCDRRAQTSQTAIAEPQVRRPRRAKSPQVRERSAAPPSPPPPALHRHRLPGRRPDGGSTFRTMGSEEIEEIQDRG
jgi:hypothetical protein